MTDLVDLRPHVEAFRAAHQIPSLVLAVVQHGRPTTTIGVAAPGHPVPDEHSVSRIASMTKSFTAAAVLALRDDGVLSLDDPIALHVPELSDLPRPTSDGPEITIRHLLTMSSGLATDDAWGDRHLDATPQQMDEWFAAVRSLAHPVAVTFEYSNLGYGMLGRLLDRLTGNGLQFISNRFLAPLGMADTRWDIDAGRAARSLQPYRVVDGVICPEGLTPLGSGGLSAMGGLWSTATDLARWVQFWCDAYPPRDEPDDAPLRRSSRRQAQQVATAFDPPDVHHRDDGSVRVVAQGYAMGLERSHHQRFGPVVGHGGGLPGYGSHMRWLPERGVGVVALANRFYAPARLLTDTVLELLGSAGAIPAAPTPDTTALDVGARRMVALLNAWDDAVAVDLFADNMALDEPLERRGAAARTLVERCGPLELMGIEALSTSNGTMTVSGPRGSVTFDIELCPIALDRVQRFERCTP